MEVKKGDRIRIIKMDDSGGKDWQAAAMNGCVGTVEFVDGAGQIFGTWGGLALIPGVDRFTVIERA